MFHVLKAWTTPRRRPVGRVALPIIKENFGEANGTTNTNDTDDTVVRGQEAWKCLKETGRTSWEQWKVVGKALVVGRDHALKVAKTDKPNGKRYSEAFHSWLQIHCFDAIEKADRHKLLSIMEDLDRIEKWRDGLTDAHRAAWNHPSTVWRVSRCGDRGIEAMERKAETPIPNPSDLPPPTPEFAEDEKELAWQRGLELRARKAIGDAKLKSLWLLPEPPTKGLISVVEEVILAWERCLEYLNSIKEYTPEELAEARKSYTEGQARVRDREAMPLRSPQEAEPILEGAD
jgi:hypothetical protein